MSSVKLYNADCLDIMANELAPQSIDLILADLPYGSTQHKDDKRIDHTILWNQYSRMLKPNGVVALFADLRFLTECVSLATIPFRYELVWDKVLTSGFLNAKRQPLRCHEYIGIFSHTSPKYNPQFTEGKPLHGRGTAFLTTELTNNNYGKFKAGNDLRKGSTQKYPKSILNFPKPRPSVAKHRTEKPVPLLEWLIKVYSDEGDVVMDNVMGCGGAGIAALNTGRYFIGIEKDEEIFQGAKKRILEWQKS